MQLKWLAIPIISASAVLSYAPAASAMSLIPMEEPVTNLVTTNPAVSPFTYSYVSSTNTLIATPVSQNPLVCADTSAPLAPGYTLNPVYYSPTGIAGATPLPFVFGATAAAPTVSAMAAGASAVLPNATGEWYFTGDAVGSLVCYGLDETGARRPTRDIFEDGVEGVTYNSSVVLSVLHVPASATDYYEYAIDVTLPPLPANTVCGAGGLDCNFVLLEGFDSSLLATSAANATSGIGGQWCQAPAGTNSCAFPPPNGGTSGSGGNINVNYTNYGTGGLATLTAPIAPAAAKTYHFVAFRYLKTGVSSLPSNVPIAIAALFSPTDLEENKLDDNVAVGTNQLSNAAPAVVQSDATWTTFSGKLGTLAENTDSGTLTFNILDQDTPDSGGQLHAAVTLNLGALSVPVTPTCTVISGTGAANRQCSMDINFADPNWWNASVDPIYGGQGNVFATDPGGVGASASIVAIDALGKAAAPISVPIHVQSKVNSAPLVAFGGAMPSAPDSKQGGTSYPTYSCSITAKSCGGTFNVVTLAGVISAQPGPAAAFDELASQTTDVNNVVCGQSGEQDAIFLNAPVATLASTNTFDLVFQLKSPLATGSSLCTVTITDKMATFPAGESAQVTPKQFRIVVNS